VPSDPLHLALVDLAVMHVGTYSNLKAGYCARSGAPAVVVRGGRKVVRRAGLTNEQRAAVASLCAEPSDGPLSRSVKHAEETFVLSRAPTQDGHAFALMTVRRGNTTPQTWKIGAGILGAGAILIVAVTVGVIASLRRGASQLSTALATLEADPRAAIDRPNATELASIAEGLSSMAKNLADAQEQELKLADKLAHAERLSALGRVVAGVAHEVRNPLAGIKLRLDLMRRELAEGSVREDVDVCLGEIARLDRMVRSLLLVGRREPGERVVMPLGAIVDERIDGARALAEERKVSVRRQGDAVAWTERDALAQVIDNLVRNAIEVSAEGAEVVVALAKDASRARLVVRDNGPGISADREKELFEPFFTTKPSGTGLGLWISRSLVDALGGSLRYVRADDATEMIVELPGEASS